MRELPAKLRVSEISLFCDAAETALLASVIVCGGPENAGSTILREPLQEDVPELKGVELLAEGSKGRPPAEWRNGARIPSSIVPRAFDYRVDQGAFFQVNRWLVDALVERVAR